MPSLAFSPVRVGGREGVAGVSKSRGQLVMGFTHMPKSLNVLQWGPPRLGLISEDAEPDVQCQALCWEWGSELSMAGLGAGEGGPRP